jgi:phage terminase large subunit-like protein
VVTITTAGEARERETSILGRMIDGNERTGEVDSSLAGLTVSRQHEARTLVFNYSAPTVDPSDVGAMKLANPASWVTPEFLSRQAANSDLTDAEVLQLHGCVWADSVAAWIDAGLWQMGFEGGAVVPVGARVAVGVDVGLVHDSTAVVVAYRREEDDRLLLGECRVWDPRDGSKVRLEDVEQHLRGLADRFDVAGVLYDPRFFERSAETLSDEGLTMVTMQQNSSEMGDAYQAFYAAVGEGRIRHVGDPVLNAHVLATAAEKTDRGWKVRKLRQSQRIDACVASVMACWGAETLVSDEALLGFFLV